MRGECELHGPLLPCLEDISQPGTKKTANFPVPSCIEIKESTIPMAGDGAFASQFIEPGSILGKSRVWSDQLLLIFWSLLPDNKKFVFVLYPKLG